MSLGKVSGDSEDSFDRSDQNREDIKQDDNHSAQVHPYEDETDFVSIESIVEPIMHAEESAALGEIEIVSSREIKIVSSREIEIVSSHGEAILHAEEVKSDCSSDQEDSQDFVKSKERRTPSCEAGIESQVGEVFVEAKEDESSDDASGVGAHEAADIERGSNIGHSRFCS